MLEYYCKDSREALDYTIDFNRFLIGREYIIGASAVITAPTVTDPGATLTITRVGYTKNQVSVWVTGGEDRVQYTVSVTIDTDQGRRKTESFLLTTNGDWDGIPVVNITDTTATIGYDH